MSPLTTVQDKAAMKALEVEEEALMSEVQSELSAELDGAAKLVVVGGLGAAEQKRSVFRFWPQVWQVRCDFILENLTEVPPARFSLRSKK